MRNNNLLVLLAAGTLLSITTMARSETIYYGSRAGMETTVIKKVGLGTANAKIFTKHTKKNAKAFCVEYEQDNSMACVNQTMNDVQIKEVITANCLDKTWTDFGISSYKIIAKNNSSEFMADYIVLNLQSSEILDGSMASGYPTAINLFMTMCPGVID
ncbi:hypothetical protein ACNSPG_22495 (plasmid) [Brucella pituitosa]|uniref:hypothetical protein n=1 Tax=Brucella pituitosa TaxID=571256 RepID=UPI003C77ADA1